MTWLLVLCVAVLPLGTRFFLGSVIPGVHEYEAILFYGSDILALLLIGWVLMRRKTALQSLFHNHGGAFLFAFLIVATASACIAPSVGLGFYSLIRLCVLVAFAYSVGVVTSVAKVFKAGLVTIALVAVLQSVVGILQFSRQESIGLQMFGEPALTAYLGGVSTIEIAGGRVLRAYGTFPHPNILAGFLAIGLIVLAYWYLWCEERLRQAIFNHPRTWWNWQHTIAALKLYVRHPYFYLRLLVASGAFLVTIGLVLSLSRSGWIAATVGIATLCLGTMKTRAGAAAALRLVLMLGVCVAISYTMFSPIISPRAQFNRSERAVDERLIYGRIGLDMMASTVAGVGIGNQVLYGVNNHLYQERGLVRSWNWEPIHNLYLLIGAELGWLGLLSFLIFLGVLAWSGRSRELWRAASLEWVVVMAMFFALLSAGLFDHYLWTIQAGRLMLWLVIGLCLSRFITSKKSA
jgi:O-antigen ligase